MKIRYVATLMLFVSSLFVPAFAGTPEQDTAKLVGRWKGTCRWTSKFDSLRGQDNHLVNGVPVDHTDKIDLIVEAGGKRVKVLRCPLIGSNEGETCNAKIQPDGSIMWSVPSLGKCFLPVVCRLTASGGKADFEFTEMVLFNWLHPDWGQNILHGETTLNKDE